MPTITRTAAKDGTARYEVQVRLAGTPPKFATFRKLADAKRWAQEVEVELREKRAFGRNLSSKRTLSQAIDRFEADYLGKLAESGRRARQLHLDYWRERFGHFRLVTLTSDLFAKAAGELAGEGRSGATVNRYLATVARVLSLCERSWHWIDRNPLRGVQREAEAEGRMRFLSDDERGRLLAACEESRNRELGPLVLLALSTGGRFSELTGLRWEEIDFDRGALTFHRTKNKERRSVPLSAPAREALGRLRPASAGKVFRQRSHRTAWELARERAGLEDFRFHDLRHTAASYLAMSGASLLEIAEILGHKTLSMVKRYAHLSAPHLAGVSERMAAKFLTPTVRDDQPAND